jgi:hypothetical protein
MFVTCEWTAAGFGLNRARTGSRQDGPARADFVRFHALPMSSSRERR